MKNNYTDTDHLKIIVKVAAEMNNGASLNAKQVRMVAEMFDKIERLQQLTDWLKIEIKNADSPFDLSHDFVELLDAEIKALETEEAQ